MAREMIGGKAIYARSIYSWADTANARATPFWRRRLPSTSGYSGADAKRAGGPVRSNGAPKRPVRFYRLSAVCQPTTENLVAGACNPLNLEFAWTAA
jgi:hypothetical protein